MNSFFSSFKRRRPSEEELECVSIEEDISPALRCPTNTTGSNTTIQEQKESLSPITPTSTPPCLHPKPSTLIKTLNTSKEASHGTLIDEDEGDVEGSDYMPTPPLSETPDTLCSRGVKARAAYYESLGTSMKSECASNEIWGSTSTSTTPWQVRSVLQPGHTVNYALQPPQQQEGFYGVDHRAIADALEQLQAQIERVTLEKESALCSLAKKEQEVQNLQRVVREMSESRSKALSMRADIQEKYVQLQSDYQRVIRVNDLTRTVTKENQSRISLTQGELKLAKQQLESTRVEANLLDTCNKKVMYENKALKEKMSLLARMDLEHSTRSVCMAAFTADKFKETY